ncbi:MAG TPA: MotA/TolQ/ExbB proton channel family protein [Chthoniobacterales bacterium]
MFSPFKPGLLTAAALLALSSFASAQEAAAPAAGAAPESHSVIELILEGGPMTVGIWVCLVLTSVTMVTFIVQNIIFLRNEKLAPPPLVDSLKQTLASGNYQEAWEICRANNSYLANVLKSGLERLGRGKEAVQEGLAEHGLREAQILRTRNSYLSVIGVVSPMIGLLGTVIGMMRAFATLATSGIKNPAALAANISEVLLATAAGLFIAIPAFVTYYIFRNRSQMVIVHADDKINDLISDIPYDELAGVRIGENFSAGVAGTGRASGESRKVSMALTTNCPVCNGSVTPGVNPCPHCAATLQWT